MTWRSFAIGFLGLAALELLVSSPTSAAKAGTLASGLPSLLSSFLDPTKPAFTTSSSTSSGPTASPGINAYAGQLGSMAGQYAASTPSAPAGFYTPTYPGA